MEREREIGRHRFIRQGSVERIHIRLNVKHVSHKIQYIGSGDFVKGSVKKMCVYNI